jgi:hypothetical protein
MHRDGPCPLIRITQLRNAREHCCTSMQGHTNNPDCRVEQWRPTDRPTDRSTAIAYLLRETRYEAASCSTSARVAAGAIHHPTMRPRVQGNWEQETYRLPADTSVTVLSCHLASFTAPGFSVSSFVFCLLVLYLLVVSQQALKAAKIIQDRTKCLLV